MTSDEAIARIRRAMDEVGDPGMEPVPRLRQEKAERLRLLSAEAADISITQQLVAKGSARVDRERATVAAVQRGIAECETRAATANERNGEMAAWRLGARWLRGEVGGSEGAPGAVVALCREWNIGRMPPLPDAEQQLAREQADAAPHIERLRLALAKWERPVVRGSIDATLPAMEMSATATSRD